MIEDKPLRDIEMSHQSIIGMVRKDPKRVKRAMLAHFVKIARSPAQNKILEILEINSRDPRVLAIQAKVATDILDRAYGKPKQQVEVAKAAERPITILAELAGELAAQAVLLEPEARPEPEPEPEPVQVDPAMDETVSEAVELGLIGKREVKRYE